METYGALWSHGPIWIPIGGFMDQSELGLMAFVIEVFAQIAGIWKL
jgi:hypothetical protein